MTTPAPAAKTVTFYYDFASPFAYLGATQIERLASAQGATVRWRPLLVGALFRRVGTADVPLFEQPEAKRRYIARDLQHWASHWQVPFAWPSRFPMRTVAALRLALAVENELGAAALARLSLALFRAYWAEDRDIADAGVLRAVAAASDVPAAVIERGLAPDAALKQQLVDITDEAVAAGVFGVPTCVVDGQLYWGQDRLELVARALAGAELPTG